MITIIYITGWGPGQEDTRTSHSQGKPSIGWQRAADRLADTAHLSVHGYASSGKNAGLKPGQVSELYPAGSSGNCFALGRGIKKPDSLTAKSSEERVARDTVAIVGVDVSRFTEKERKHILLAMEAFLETVGIEREEHPKNFERWDRVHELLRNLAETLNWSSMPTRPLQEVNEGVQSKKKIFIRGLSKRAVTVIAGLSCTAIVIGSIFATLYLNKDKQSGSEEGLLTAADTDRYNDAQIMSHWQANCGPADIAMLDDSIREIVSQSLSGRPVDPFVAHWPDASAATRLFLTGKAANLASICAKREELAVLFESFAELQHLAGEMLEALSQTDSLLKNRKRALQTYYGNIQSIRFSSEILPSNVPFFSVRDRQIFNALTQNYTCYTLQLLNTELICSISHEHSAQKPTLAALRKAESSLLQIEAMLFPETKWRATVGIRLVVSHFLEDMPRTIVTKP